MGINKEFDKLSYERHDKHLYIYAHNGEEEKLAKTWLNEHTVDSWCHERVYSLLDPLIEVFPEAKWLTVGDGRYGSDAHYIKNKGAMVLATDISEALLREGKEIGYIEDYRKENAESLSFPDRVFDFVFCKEAYHHFPRPMIALYEMLRVAKKGIVLIEPNDNYGVSSFIKVLYRNFKDLIKVILGRKVNKHNFEGLGNYCYTINKREIEKVALGMNFKVVAFKGINVYYLKGGEYEKATNDSKLLKKVKRRIANLDLLTRLGCQEHSMLAAVIFKENISLEINKALITGGYEVIVLPCNPYV